MVARKDSAAFDIERFQQEVRTEALEPLWLQAANVLSPEPVTHVQPYLWRWTLVRERILQAGTLVPLGKDGADRRVLALKNPGLRLGIATTQTLTAAVQLVHAGEQALSHRHSPAAIRFIIEGQGAWTVVDGQPCSMAPGDLILTPNWTWHGHVNAGNSPMIWLDVLDVPLVVSLNQVFYEEYPSGLQPTERAHDDSLLRYGAGTLLPTWEHPRTAYSPLFSYKWEHTVARLHDLAQMDGSPYDGVALSYTNPFTGGPVLPTMACYIQLLRPREHTRAHRHTASVIYHVVRGQGATIVNGTRLAWGPGDTFSLPTWVWHEHVNDSDIEEAILFSVSDMPVLRALDLYREEPYVLNGGRQSECTG